MKIFKTFLHISDQIIAFLKNKKKLKNILKKFGRILKNVFHGLKQIFRRKLF